jgi:uncharacterized protein (TIGR04552 family)
MPKQLTLGELERARLVLRGGTVIDWRRLNVSSLDDCDAILRANEYHPDDPGDTARLYEIRKSAIDYLGRNFGFEFEAAVTDADSTSTLMLLAAGRDTVLRPQACMILKLMQIVHHVEARELRSKLAVSDQELYHLVENKALRIAREMEDLGYPIVEFKISHKTHDSLITKLLSKKQASRAFVFDMIRFRIVTATVEDIIPVVSYLCQHLFPFNFTVPGESHNSIFAFQDFARNHASIRALIPELQVDLKYEDEMRPPGNNDTSNAFRTVNFVVDLPLRLSQRDIKSWAPGISVYPAIVHVAAEFQIVDRSSHASNERGEASHEKYKERRMAKVQKRLLRGIMVWRGKKG